MSNEYYTPTGTPSTRSNVSSQPMRSEAAAVAAGFDKLPVMAGNSLLPVRVNQAETALEAHTPFGSYTPVGVLGANAAVITPAMAYWTRVGPYVHVFGRVSVDAALTDTRTIFYLDLPVASNFSTNAQLCGTFAGNYGGATNAGVIVGDVSNDRAIFDIVVQSASEREYYYQYSYVIV